MQIFDNLEFKHLLIGRIFAFIDDKIPAAYKIGIA
jgi:hypothetical protein